MKEIQKDTHEARECGASEEYVKAHRCWKHIGVKQVLRFRNGVHERVRCILCTMPGKSAGVHLAVS